MPVFECTRCNDMTYSASTGAMQPCAQCGSHELRVLQGYFPEARTGLRELGPGDHAALVYDDPEVVAPFCARFLEEGVEAGAHVVAAVPGNLRAPVEELLDASVAADVDWHDIAEIYRDFDPDRIADTYETMILGEQRPTRILAGLDEECAEGVETSQFDRYERLAHAIITSRLATAVCVFDSGSLPEEFIEVAMLRHGLVVSETGVRRNERFEYAPL
jgi:hypothetical protein